MVTAEVAGQTETGYDGMLGMLEQYLTAAPGFILHTAYPIEGGWRVVEIWESKEAANRFFADNVHPNLPPGIRPVRTFQELHSLIRP